MIWLVIFTTALVVFVNRYLFLEPSLPIKLSPTIKKLLGFSIPAILTAICGPIIFLDDHGFRELPLNPYFIGAVISVLLALFIRNTLVSVILSLLIFMLLKQVILS
ncbi:AzlD domain-containing protein [Budviciaceae bacterium BWR-B9]|uniref:AzlD domain-containing protein n=1 Tax=Limnobaculum allomyrinae TaxID=2791986 RepID=A0ABS1IVE6_9GAMM|nr:MULTISPECIES: AzlD domain-containing protein [Limnobaculum]MBK5145731.1 AzlD domain-containing protein [Limnobaculum allomyrinae]MBV7693735.1 AzlD domain-containing protein [Limnobaculum sp. M2-1]